MKRYIKRWISFILFMCVFVWYPSEGVVMAADSGQKNIDIVGTASMNTYDVAVLEKQSSLCVMERPERWCGSHPIRRSQQ